MSNFMPYDTRTFAIHVPAGAAVELTTRLLPGGGNLSPSTAPDPDTGGRPFLAWRDAGHGDRHSQCDRFHVVRSPRGWQGVDGRAERRGDCTVAIISQHYPTRRQAEQWCEARALLSPDGSEGNPIPTSRLVWGPQDSRGQSLSACRNFAVLSFHKRGGLWRGADYRTRDTACSPDYSQRRAAELWCENRFSHKPGAAHRGDVPPASGAHDANGQPHRATTRAERLVNHNGLEWQAGTVTVLATNVPGTTERTYRSKCGRFHVVPQFDGAGHVVKGRCDTRRGIETLYTAIDCHATLPEHRYSPTGHLDDVQEWAEERSRYAVRTGLDGCEQLVRAVESASAIGF